MYPGPSTYSTTVLTDSEEATTSMLLWYQFKLIKNDRLYLERNLVITTLQNGLLLAEFELNNLGCYLLFKNF